MEFSIDRLAALAKLSLDEKEKKRLETDLAGILAYVDQLREVDTDAIDEIIHTAPETNVLRADELPKKDKEEMKQKGEYVRVPLVINKM